MKNYIIYFVDYASAVNSQAALLEQQISKGEYTIEETPEQRERNRGIVNHLEAEYEDLHEYQNPFGREESEELGIPWVEENPEAAIILSDTQGLELRFSGNYLFIHIPQIKSMWESDIIDKRLVEIISYCQNNYTVLAFDEEDKELLDDLSKESQI